MHMEERTHVEQLIVTTTVQLGKDICYMRYFSLKV
jgi:hypothetical protein